MSNALIAAQTPNSARRREGDVRKDALQPARLLQDERAVALRFHDDPGEAHGVHMPGFVHPEHGVEAVAP